MKQKKNMEWVKYLSYFLILLVPVFKVAHAATVDTTISADEKAKFDQMLTPIAKVYHFIQYGATLLGVIFLSVAGVKYMMSGDDIKKRESAKHTAAFTLIGLAVIWAAPTTVSLLTA